MRRWALASLLQLALLWGSVAQGQVLKSASTLSPGSLMLSVAPVYVFDQASNTTFLFLGQAAVGLVKDWDLVFTAGWGPGSNMVPYVGGRVEAPLAQDQEGQPGVAFGLGVHWGYAAGLPFNLPANDSTGIGMFSVDTVLILSKGVGNFVGHAAVTLQFVIPPSGVADDPLYIEGILSLGGQYLFSPHISLMAEAGFNAARSTYLGRYITLSFVFYAL